MKSDYNTLVKTSKKTLPGQLVHQIGFQKSLTTARAMLLDKEWDSTLHEYAVKLLEEIRKQFPEKWSSSWQYEAFLGYAYDITLRYDERYDAYTRALKQTETPPPQLLVALAGCEASPGTPPISIEQAIELLKQAVQDTPYREAIEFLMNLYRYTGNNAEVAHWKSILEKAQGEEVRLPSLDEIDELKQNEE